MSFVDQQTSAAITGQPGKRLQQLQPQVKSSNPSSKKQARIEDFFTSPSKIAPRKTGTDANAKLKKQARIEDFFIVSLLLDKKAGEAKIQNDCNRMIHTPMIKAATAAANVMRQELKQIEPKKGHTEKVQEAIVTRSGLRDRKAMLVKTGNHDGTSNKGFNTSPRDSLSIAKGKENFSQVALKQRPSLPIKLDKCDNNSKNAKSPAVVASPEYLVEKILDVQIIAKTPCFHIKWKNYTPTAWEPLENVRSSSLLHYFLSEAMMHDSVRSTIDDIKNTVRMSDRYREALTLHEGGLKPANEIISEYEQYDFDQLRTDLLVMAKLRINCLPNKGIWNRIEQAMCRELSFSKREAHLAQLLAFETKIKSHESTLRVVVANDIDLDPPPSNFTYLRTSFSADGIIISNDPPKSCTCNPCNVKTECCSRLSGGDFAYTTNRRLRLQLGYPIYECNKLCSCGADCRNRVVQNGSHCNLTLFKTSNGRGWGLKTNDIINKGQYISEYCGQVIRREEAENMHNANGYSYLFDLDFFESDCPFTIDATMFGNISRFYNHSCEPNCAIWPVWVDCLDRNLPRLALFALRRIEPDEELTFDYAIRLDAADDRASKEGEAEDDASTGPINIASSSECLCGSSKCRKRLWITG